MEQRKFTAEELEQLSFLASGLKTVIKHRSNYPDFDIDIEVYLKQIAIYLFSICPSCGQRHPKIVVSEAEEEKMKIISELIGQRLTSH